MDQLKGHKCYSCKKSSSELTKLPFGRLICTNCIDLECKNELESERDDLDRLDPRSLLLDRVDAHFWHLSQLGGNRAHKLALARSQINEIVNCYIRCARGRYKPVSDAYRLQVSMNCMVFKSCLEDQLNHQLDLIDSHGHEVVKNHTSNAAKVLSRIDELLGALKKIEFESEAQVSEYEAKIRHELFQCRLILSNGRMLTVKPVQGRRSKLATLENNQGEIEETAEPTPFSMESILAGKKSSLTYKLVSIEMLNRSSSNDSCSSDMHLLLFKCVQNPLWSRLKLYFYEENNRVTSQIDLKYPHTELYMMCAAAATRLLVLCSRLTTHCGSFLNLTLYNTRFVVVREKLQPILDLNRYRPLQLLAESSCDHASLVGRCLVLVMDVFDSSLHLFVFNLNLDLLNSFQLAKPFENVSKDLKSSRVFILDQTIYLKRRSPTGSNLTLFSLIDGSLVDEFELPHEFDEFHVSKLVDGSRRLAFMLASSPPKMLVYDVSTRTPLYATYVVRNFDQRFDMISPNNLDRGILSTIHLRE